MQSGTGPLGDDARSADGRRGSITVLCGCMFSGKTTDLLRRLAHGPARSTLLFKHVIDDRYQPDAVVSHGGKARTATRINSARDIQRYVHDEIETVAIDEGHFFDAALVEVAHELAARGLSVIVTALDLDCWGRPFPVIRQLCAMANETVVKHAVCGRCGAAADRTQRLTPIVDRKMVGGPEHYEPRCQKCWLPPVERPFGRTRARG